MYNDFRLNREECTMNNFDQEALDYLYDERLCNYDADEQDEAFDGYDC